MDCLGPATPMSQVAGSWRLLAAVPHVLHPRHSRGGKEAWRDHLEPATPVSQVAGAWRESGSWAAVPQVLQSAGGPVTELKTGMRCAARLTRTAAAAKMMSLGRGCT